MKSKLNPRFLVPLALWSAVCFGLYFYAAAKQIELVMHLYLILSTLLALGYLLLQSPAVAVKGQEEENRKRSPWLSLEGELHRKLSRLLLCAALPMLFTFLLDYLMILWNFSPF